MALVPVLGLWLALHPLPVRAATDKPWAVDNPAGAEARFGLGLGFYAERQEGLEITFQRTRTELSSPDGESGAFTTQGDPELLNRKFDPEWQLRGPVAQVPVALRTLGAEGGPQLFSALALELTQAHVDLDIHDRSAPDLRNSLSGDGVMAGASLDLVMTMCRLCPWFAGGGYRYSALPEMAVDRSPEFAAPGFAVTADAASLSGRTQEAFLRWGYAPWASRFATYFGVRYRSTSVTVDGELRLVSDQTQLVTNLVTRTRFESEATLAMAGVDAHLGSRFFGRTEVTYGDGHTSLLVTVVYLHRPPRAPVPPVPTPDPPQDRTKEQESARASEIAAKIAPELALIEEEFLASWEGLTEFVVRGTVVYQHTEVKVLLDTLEARLLEALSGHDELAAMRDYVRQRLREAKQQLDLLPSGSARFGPYPSGEATFALVSSGAAGPTAPSGPSVSQQQADLIRDRQKSWMDRLLRLFASNNLTLNLCITSHQAKRAEFGMWPESYPRGKHTVNTDGELVNVYRGLYLYRVTRPGHKTIEDYQLNLVDDSRPVVVCELVETSSLEPALSCDRREGNPKECPQ